MRVLFLDFDGVVHPAPWLPSTLTHWCWLPLLAQTPARHEDVRLVVHSTWRHEYNLDELRELLDRLGPRVVGATAGGDRLQGIEVWLADHPEVTSYRLLDDDLADFYRRPAELILCDPAKGLSDADARRHLTDQLEAEGIRPAKSS